jgi:hypothetical protein
MAIMAKRANEVFCIVRYKSDYKAIECKCFDRYLIGIKSKDKINKNAWKIILVF